jgi:hypothetical protein
MPFASYAVDIGMYHVGAKGQMCADTTTAWARSGEGTPSFNDITYSGSCDEGAFAKSTQRWSCGRSISRLVDRIAADIDAGCSVSLGLEAPMWFPIGLKQCANLQLFNPRCDDERGSECYVQSGAAATVKAISIAAMLVNLLTSKQPGVKLTTDPSSGADGAITLYEAFVVGKGEFKMPVPAVEKMGAGQADANLPTTTPCPSGLSLLILFPMPLHFFALTFWGFTENPYRGREGPWIRPGDDLAMLVIFLIGFCLVALGYFLYQLGKLSGILERRKMEIDL